MILLYFVSLCRMNTGSIFSSEISSRQGYFHQLLSLYIMYIVVFLFSLGVWMCLAGCSGDRTVRSSNGHLKREDQIIPLEFHPTRGENYNCSGSEQTKRNMMLIGSHAQHGSDSLRTCH